MAGTAGVSIVRLTTSERNAFLEAEMVRYAEAKSRAGVWTPDEAPARAREEIEQLLHGRPELRGHRFYKALDGSRREIGWAWIGPVPGTEADRRTRWLFQILVKEEFRGQGFGRALLRAAEERAASDGAEMLGLNVWAFNDVARSLYESSGYETVARYPAGTEMRKHLASK
ncbi:MAG TPA: GNAT family N-acetyltransferase [Thermoplasmata archaeon]|nr:GNAT family N-acetyltransferase [Thermoplasmata archaeon]